MDAVADEASVSKATIYVYFKGKADLFASVVGMSGDSYSSCLTAGAAADEKMRDTLMQFGRAILVLLLAPETIAAYRMVVSEASRSPELGRIFYENGPVRLLDRLEQLFGTAMADGVLRRSHPRRAAEQFIGLVRGDLQLCALLGVQKKISKAEQDARVSSGVDTFWRAYGLGREGSPT